LLLKNSSFPQQFHQILGGEFLRLEGLLLQVA